MRTKLKPPRPCTAMVRLWRVKRGGGCGGGCVNSGMVGVAVEVVANGSRGGVGGHGGCVVDVSGVGWW
nr:hypothetical protein [Tanacetum cinerariifolium]